MKHVTHKPMKYRAIAVLAGITLGLAAQSALADGWPPNISGNWSVIGNQSPGTLSITQFAGAAGSQCKPIRGTIYGNPMEGFYCPGSGRIAFLRKFPAPSTATFQSWSGNLSADGSLDRIGGTFNALTHNNVIGTSGSLGEYNFQAVK